MFRIPLSPAGGGWSFFCLLCVEIASYFWSFFPFAGKREKSARDPPVSVVCFQSSLDIRTLLLGMQETDLSRARDPEKCERGRLLPTGDSLPHSV